MRTRFIAVPVALIATLGLATAPIHADDPVEGDVTETPTDELVEDCPAPEDTTDVESDLLLSAALTAAEAAEDLEADEVCDDGLKLKSEEAIAALTAARDRKLERGNGNGVAVDVLTALIEGRSPAGIGAAHGAAMAEEAKTRNAERKAEREHTSDADDATETDTDTDESESIEDESGERGRPEQPGKSSSGNSSSGKSKGGGRG